ncbi:MAG: hypothetical protein ABIF40_01520 [archaeon]
MTDYKKLGRLGFTGFAGLIGASVLTYFVATASCWKGEEQENQFEIELTEEEKEKQQCLEPTDESLVTTLTTKDYEKAVGFEHEAVYQGKEFDYEIKSNRIAFWISESSEIFVDTLICNDYDFDGEIDRLHYLNGNNNSIWSVSWRDGEPDLNNIDLETALEWRTMCKEELDKFEERENIPELVKAYIKEGHYSPDKFRTD